MSSRSSLSLQPLPLFSFHIPDHTSYIQFNTVLISWLPSSEILILYLGMKCILIYNHTKTYIFNKKIQIQSQALHICSSLLPGARHLPQSCFTRYCQTKKHQSLTPLSVLTGTRDSSAICHAPSIVQPPHVRKKIPEL